MTVFLDTDVMVAACLEEHEHHGRALPLVSGVHSNNFKGFTSAHAVIEAYSAITRLPRSPRLVPSEAAALIQENILKYFSLVALTAKESAELVLKLGIEGIAGGQTYDALHLACARKCNADRIYTFNIRHFQSLAEENLRSRIVSP